MKARAALVAAALAALAVRASAHDLLTTGFVETRDAARGLAVSGECALQESAGFQKVGMTLAAAVGDRAPEFTLKDAKGQDVRLSDFLGQVVVLDFWASWCPPCRMSSPYLDALQKKMGPRVVVLGVNIKESAGQVTSYMSSHGYSYRSVLDTTGSVADQYGVRGIPTFVVINKFGKIVLQTSGFAPGRTDAAIDAAVESALKESITRSGPGGKI